MLAAETTAPAPPPVGGFEKGGLKGVKRERYGYQERWDWLGGVGGSRWQCLLGPAPELPPARGEGRAQQPPHLGVEVVRGGLVLGRTCCPVTHVPKPPNPTPPPPAHLRHPSWSMHAASHQHSAAQHSAAYLAVVVCRAGGAAHPRLAELAEGGKALGVQLAPDAVDEGLQRTKIWG